MFVAAAEFAHNIIMNEYKFKMKWRKYYYFLYYVLPIKFCCIKSQANGKILQ